MLNKYNIGNYYLKDSIIHKLNPTMKIIILLLNIFICIICSSIIDYILLFIYIILIIFLSKIDFKIYLKNILTLKIFILFLIIINLFFKVPFLDTFNMLFKLIMLVLFSTILTFTTTPLEITYGLERVFRCFNRIIPVNNIALSITLALRFIPVITMQSERIIKASSLRGIDYNKSIKTKLKSITLLFVPLLYLTCKKSDDLSEIMEVRLYNYGLSRTNYRINKITYKDILLLIINIFILLIILWR